jgi:hypothetical protein
VKEKVQGRIRVQKSCLNSAGDLGKLPIFSTAGSPHLHREEMNPRETARRIYIPLPK